MEELKVKKSENSKALRQKSLSSQTLNVVVQAIPHTIYQDVEHM